MSTLSRAAAPAVASRPDACGVTGGRRIRRTPPMSSGGGRGPRAGRGRAGLGLAAGRPMVHDLRAMLDAVFYVARNGVEWRALPADFPPHAAVYKFFERWSQRELPETLVHRLRRRLRVHQGRDG